ncbi:hypothetical protein [Roseovarius dicentrarchi]|uniref:hypothetical protein n=1 Tax=Roseovarius dicentrarchi TaxID=2250573 RepID=UPI000DEB5281|nr:hypothetical protein [Roseovarius dicentrarchi]
MIAPKQKDYTVMTSRATRKTKQCLWCGSEFTYERSTKKHCSENCRRAFNIKAQRKREKENERRRTREALRRRWVNLEERRADLPSQMQDALADEYEGYGNMVGEKKSDQIGRKIEEARPLWDRDERMIRRDAEKAGIPWEQVIAPKKPRKARPSAAKPSVDSQMVVQREQFVRPPSRPMPKIETKRERKVLHRKG